jgi:hypothetical protein
MECTTLLVLGARGELQDRLEEQRGLRLRLLPHVLAARVQAQRAQQVSWARHRRRMIVRQTCTF